MILYEAIGILLLVGLAALGIVWVSQNVKFRNWWRG